MKIYQWKSSLLESELTPNAKLVGIVISEFYRDGTDCYPSLSTILRFTSFGSINTVQNAIKELKENEFIKVGNKTRNHIGGRPCNLYIFCGVEEQLSSSDSSDDSSDDSSHERSHDISPRDKETTKSTEVTKSIKEKKDNAEEMKTIWNETCVSLPPIRILNDTRKRKMNELIGSMKIKDPEGKPLFEDVSDWQYICEEIQKTPFLCGENDRNWRADIDFCLQKSNLIKIYEGKYDSKK